MESFIIIPNNGIRIFKRKIYISELLVRKWYCSRVLTTLLDGQYGGLDREILLIYVIN